jgi:hypothetical protein
MKIPLLITCATLALAGCSTYNDSGYPGPVFETTAGRGVGLENDLNLTADPRGAWQNWRYGGDPDRIAPKLPLDPEFPPAPAPRHF